MTWLIRHGADVNGYNVMATGYQYGTAAILQLLIDAGGDVNVVSCKQPYIFWVVGAKYREVGKKVKVLLKQPTLDLTVRVGIETADAYARANGLEKEADRIAEEVLLYRCDDWHGF